VGIIENQGSDFPSFSGKFTKNPKLENKKISEYISYSTKRDDETYDASFTEEKQFIELINSEGWYLVDENNSKTLILVPVFHRTNGISWRLNFGL
jgi:hypothetical protein